MAGDCWRTQNMLSVSESNVLKVRTFRQHAIAIFSKEIRQLTTLKPNYFTWDLGKANPRKIPIESFSDGPLSE